METDDDQLRNLMLLADMAIYVSELEKKLTFISDRKRKFEISSSPLSEEETPTKIWKPISDFGPKNGQNQTSFALGNIGDENDHQRISTIPLWPTETKKKRTTIGRNKLPMRAFSSLSPSSPKKKEKKPKTPRPRVVLEPLAPPREMPAVLRDMLVNRGGGEFVLIVQKPLTATDVKTNNSRLSMAGKSVKARMKEFLSVKEWQMVRVGRGVDVEIVDEEARVYRLRLRLWDMTKTATYNIIAGWNDFAKINALKEKNIVQVWAFRRRDSKLGFVVVKLPSE